ncbi:PepSY domain-containing protein [Tateyamaria sp. syn59]|uniref:PepSY-associated TM helix domain-containing protein n=1 Tax=Tateyamaria sp. syn59 TaxID=2576942 RepID=UPI0011BF9638|nr:PepSY-associated TM helix domain-containing protein [Tateyamaria sp. syn59]
MRPEFKDSMDWLHTWSGVILGAVMFAIFWMGTLSVFKDETDQWFWPYARDAAPAQIVSADAILDTARAHFSEHDLDRLVLAMPTDRAPAPSIIAFTEKGSMMPVYLDQHTLQITGELDSGAASYFFYPFHYQLNIGHSGRWIVGLTSMFLLLGLFSGIIIHKKIFVDFFTFRAAKKLPRKSLDLHNMTSVFAMPFHLMITITGVLIFATFYLEASLKGIYGQTDGVRAQVANEVQSFYAEQPDDQTVHLGIASLDAMIIRAQREWGPGFTVKEIYIDHLSRADGTVRIRANIDHRIDDYTQPITFDKVSGEMLTEPWISSAGYTQAFIRGMHEIHFDHTLLRWLYVAGGIAGCIMIATGYIYWLESRRRKHSRQGGYGLPVVEALTIWGVMGMLSATAAYFFANRVLPGGQWEFLGILKIFWEVIIFYLVYLLALVHGGLRKKKAWFDQAVLIAFLCFGAAVANWITTGDHLILTVSTGHWAIAGIDLSLLVCCAVSAYAAHRLRANWAIEAETARSKSTNRSTVTDSQKEQAPHPVASVAAEEKVAAE